MVVSLIGQGNIKAAATMARHHQRGRWLSNWQAPTPWVATRLPQRQFMCLSGIIYSNHSELVRYRYNAGINRLPPSPPLSSRMPIAGEFKCLQRTEHHGSHLVVVVVCLFPAQSYKHYKNKTWYITANSYAGGRQRSQWLIVLAAVILVINVVLQPVRATVRARISCGLWEKCG